MRLLTVSVRLHHVVSAGVHFGLWLKKKNQQHKIQYRAWLSPDSVDHTTTEATCPHSHPTLSRFACSGCDYYRTRKHVRRRTARHHRNVNNSELLLSFAPLFATQGTVTGPVWICENDRSFSRWMHKNLGLKRQLWSCLWQNNSSSFIASPNFSKGIQVI